MDSTMTPAPSGVATELASAGFADAREVGRRGGGVVYGCYQTSLRRKVAVKVLVSDAEEDKERFLRAGCAMGRLSGHPNIVSIMQVGVTESNRPYVVMPNYAADSLGLRLRLVGPIQWPEALRIGVKLCGALETAHRAGILHRDIHPGNVLLNDYGEPHLTDFGIAYVAGGDERATGFFTDPIAYTAPEVLAGSPPTASADIFSLGATLYALIAGSTARNAAEDLVAHHLRISSAPVPDMRPKGIPENVCASIETAMSLDPAKRQRSAAEFARELQAAQHRNGQATQHRNGVVPDSMAFNGAGKTVNTVGIPAIPPQTEQAVSTEVSEETSIPPSVRPVSAWSPDAWPIPPLPPAALLLSPKKRRRTPIEIAAAIGTLLLVLGGVYLASLSLVAPDRPPFAPDGSLVAPDTSDGTGSATEPATAAPAVWQPIANARVSRAAVAATQADGTIWILGGIGADGIVSGRYEGYDPAIDAWKGGDDLPVPVLHAMSVTWQDTPVVLGGWRSSGGAGKMVATDRVWRLVNGHWAELPHMLQPRAAAAAAVVGDRIIVTGGVGANGALLNTTEIFDGKSWTLGAELPTPRLLLAAASDDKLVYAVGGINGADPRSVEAYDPVANTWIALPDLPQARSDLGVAIVDGRLLAVGGVSAGQVLKSVTALDLPTLTWVDLPDMGTARHGMAVATVANSVYAVGGSTSVDDREVTSSAEALKLPARKTQPASHWRPLPDALTPRLTTAWTVLDGKVWIARGSREATTSRTVEGYDPAARTRRGC